MTTKRETIPDIESIAADLVKQSLKILDATQRAAYASEKLSKMDDPVIVEILHAILCNAAKRFPGFREFAESGINGVMLKEKLGSFKFSRVFHFAGKHEYNDIVSIFTSSLPVRISDSDESMFLVYGVPDQTIGHRKALARSHDKTVLDKIGYDINPLVIDQLLRNPKITEDDVVKIAARRPNHAKILTVIFNNKRWTAYYKVKLALAANPYSPPGISRQLLPFLFHKDLCGLALDGAISQEVKSEARRIAQIKKDPDTVHIPPVDKEPEEKPLLNKRVYDIED